MNRRIFISNGAAAFAGIRLSSNSESLFAANPVRQSVNTMSASSPVLLQYAKAVDIMKKLAPDDPRNWQNQATIHNKFCPHTNWWFLPWHRAYLFYFESICQNILSDPSFRLPYWNWTADASIPAPFLDQNSSLFNGTRLSNQVTADVSQATVNTIVGSNSLIDVFSGATRTDNQREGSKQGALELGPHNGVHATILGDMGTFMSPLDPIFWLHHCNIDRIWASWSKSASHQPPPSPLWSNHSLTTFYDPVTKAEASPKTVEMKGGKWLAKYDAYEGTPGPVAVKSLLGNAMLFSAIIAAPGGGNATAPLPAATIPVPSKTNTVADTDRGVTVGQGLNFSLALPKAPLANKTQEMFLAEPLNKRETYLTVEDVPNPTTLSVALRIFLNCENPTVKTPITDETYLGTISFFGGNHGDSPDAHTQSSFALNVSSTLERIRANGAYKPGTDLKVALVAVDLLHPERVSPDEVIRPARLSFTNFE